MNPATTTDTSKKAILLGGCLGAAGGIAIGIVRDKEILTNAQFAHALLL